jgi:hypothetical protein
MMRQLATEQLTVEPETVLPVQFFPASFAGAEQPEKRLMLAILSDALSTLLRSGHDAELANRSAVDEVLAWCSSRDVLWPFSFENICAALGINADALREGIRRLHQAPARQRAAVVSLPASGRMAGHRHRVTLRRSQRRNGAAR